MSAPRGILLLVAGLALLVLALAAGFVQWLDCAPPTAGFLAVDTLLVLWILYRLAGWDPGARRARRLGGFRLEQLDALDGVAFERWVGERLAHEGLSVHPTRATGDYGLDWIVALDGQHLGIEVKRRARPVGNAEVRSAVAGAQHHGCAAVLVVTNAGFSTPAETQARAAALPVTLVGGEELHRLGDWVRGAAAAAAEAASS